jgi:hypothetical protein
MGAQGLWNRFNDFTNADFEQMQKTGNSDVDIANRPISDMIRAMKDWLEEQDG